MSTTKIKSYCRVCERETNHAVLARETESYREDYACDYDYQIVECQGCDSKAFRQVFSDIESAYPPMDEHDDWEVPETVNIYPKFLRDHRELPYSHLLPRIVDRVYSEVLLALQEEATILASLGLRGTIEAVCNDLDISSRNLESRISKLSSAGYISKRDSERLHAIRFMGNDAAHDIKKPEKEALKIALQIIEHLLSSVYILPELSEGNMETAVSDYSKFESLLVDHIDDFSKGDEYPLAQLMGRDLRRIKDSMSALEQELNERIKSGKFDGISLGRVAKFKNSNNELQHYVVESES